uniref:Tsg C-terminal domain-containing protein n=1 Tax=Megaselia scalaris TaxID=36166 RepID=T1H300_MEGSC
MCKKCLDKHYTECCPCVDMCPTETARNVTESEISEFHGNAAIFDALAKMPDNSLYLTYTNGELIPADRMIEYDEVNDKNCTVLFWNTCMTNKKCEAACENMGAKSSRWFLDGCCQCIGENCIPSGISESKCASCPYDEEEMNETGFDYDTFDEDDLQFGEGTEMMSVKSEVGELPESPVNFTSFVDFYDKMLTIHEIP